MFLKAVDHETGAAAPEAAVQSAKHIVPQDPPAAVRTPSIVIPKEMQVIGKVVVEGDLYIDGKIEGDVVSKSVTVSERAVVNGQVEADEIEVRGHVNGGVRGRKVLLANACHVKGDILHQSLSVECGAIFDGNCQQYQDPVKPTAAAEKEDPSPRESFILRLNKRNQGKA